MGTRANFKKSIHRARLLRAMKLGDKMPRDHTGTYHNVPVYSNCVTQEPWAYLTIIVRAGVPAGSRKSSAHRTFVECKCGKTIPTGRYHQHASACGNPL